jgi:hypothetical protein
MGGLVKICKAYGGLKVIDKKGNEANWEYDYKKDKPLLKKKRKNKNK